MAEDVEMVTITHEEFRQLNLAGALLGALKTAGVEKWDGFPIAAGLFEKAIQTAESQFRPTIA